MALRSASYNQRCRLTPGSGVPNGRKTTCGGDFSAGMAAPKWINYFRQEWINTLIQARDRITPVVSQQPFSSLREPTNMKQQILIIGAGFAGMWSALSAVRLLDQQQRLDIDVTLLAPQAELRVRPRFYEPDLASTVAPLGPLFDAVGVPCQPKEELNRMPALLAKLREQASKAGGPAPARVKLCGRRLIR